MEVTFKEIPFEEVDNLPETIYKYRTYSDKWHKTILIEQAVFMAQPTSFEDKMDCKNLIRYDLLTPVEIYDKYYNHSKVLHPQFDELDHRAFAVKEFYKSPMFDQNHNREIAQDYFRDFDARFGVLSLTANPKNPKMWIKYSEDHQGFCVGFHTTIMFKHLGGGGEVQYEKILPDILPSDDLHVEHWKQVFFKEVKWNFEDEYRTHKFWPNPATTADRTIVLSKDCFKEIVFGALMSAEHQKEIIEICQLQGLNVTFFKAKINEGDGSITIENL